MLWVLMFSAYFAYIHNTVLGKVPDKGLLAYVASIGDQSKDKTAESNTVSDPAAPSPGHQHPGMGPVLQHICGGLNS